MVHKVRIAHESKGKREELTKISDLKIKNKGGTYSFKLSFSKTITPQVL